MSDFKFVKIGNQKDYQHYKKVLEIMLFDIFARVTDFNLKKAVFNIGLNYPF